MKRLDRFILSSFLGPFILTFFIVVFILVMQFLWLYIDDLVGKGLSFGVIMEYLGWGAATILPHALPLATLLASIMTLGSFGENNELLAMKAAGISLQRILYPLIYVSIAICIGAFFISNDLIPVAYNKIYTLQYDIGKTKEEIKIPTRTFYNGIDGYVLRINSRNEKTDMMYDVMVYNHTTNKGNVSVAVADSGSIVSTKDKKSLIFTLYHGISYEEDNKKEYRDTSYVLQKVVFDRQELIIPIENYNFEKSDEERYGSQIMAKDLAELRTDRDSIGAIYDDVFLRQQERLVYAARMDKASQLDTAKNKGLRTKMEYDSLFNWKSAKDELKAVRDAIVALNAPISTLESFERETYQQAYSLRRIDLESFRKFTLSFACLIFFFIGAPLGAIIRKGGLGTPVIISALFFVLYWVIDISGKKLARDAVLSPAMGAFISTLVLLPIGVFLTWKATKDSSLFNTDSYILALKKFFNRFSRYKIKTEAKSDDK